VEESQMEHEEQLANPKAPSLKSALKMRPDSLLYERIVPVALVVAAVVTAVLILFALAILLGLIAF
jgi:hypothetical protein